MLTGVWDEVRVVPETGSTNADLLLEARAGVPEGAVLVAERQTAGRGRLDRAWQAPAGTALTFSVLLRPDLPGTRLGWLPLLAGVAVVDAVNRLAAVDAGLKWPNDLLVRPADGRLPYGKCAGILAEAASDAVVLGIGLNVTQSADELPEPVDPRAYRPTSLALAGSPGIDRMALLGTLLESLADHYHRWVEAGGDPVVTGIAPAYRRACLTIGRDVAVSLPGAAELLGRATDVDDDGRLVVVTPAGPRALAAGDVLHVR
jgi:BirA family biotin operon repressor/biotin-[acetyl-CoA-carboxylase] ligase